MTRRRRDRDRPGARRRRLERRRVRRRVAAPTRSGASSTRCTSRPASSRPPATRTSAATVTDLIGDERRLYPVGRLDADTTGLILLTNDGELANRLTHPRFEVPKTYRAHARRPADRRPRAARAARGRARSRTASTAPARVKRLAAHQLELTIHEGRKRQVRRMCEAVGHPVQALVRVRFGSLALGELGVGRSRRLSPAEVQALTEIAQDPPSTGASAASGAPRRRPTR